jgi:hypothetical protein
LFTDHDVRGDALGRERHFHGHVLFLSGAGRSGPNKSVPDRQC